MTPSLKSRTIHGLFWTFSESVGLQAVQLVIYIVLARLLLPGQFGLISMLTVFIAIAKSFVESGFGMALIQKKHTTYVDECSVFYFNIIIAFLAAGAMCLIAPWVADFYNAALLKPLTRVLSLVPIIGAFGLVHRTLLSKHLDFKTQLKVAMTATTLSGVIGITMAVCGCGVWSLAAQSIGNALFRTVFLWHFSTWRPKLVFSFRALRELFGFGSRLLASGLLNTAFENVYLVVIGKLFSAGHLGLYFGARKIQHIPTLNIAAVVTRVTFPVFSTIQNNANRMKHCMRKALTTLAFGHFPMMIGLALIAKPLILVLLTEKWVPAAPWLQLLCVANLLYPLQSLHQNVLKAKGRSDLFFRLEVLKKILVVISVSITWRWGVSGLICGQIVLSVVSYIIGSFCTWRLIGYTLREQMSDLAPYLAVSMVMGCGIYLVQGLPFGGHVTLLAVEIVVGVLLYAVLSCVLALPACVEIVNMARDRLRPGAAYLEGS